jgi:hypothetical protein
MTEEDTIFVEIMDLERWLQENTSGGYYHFYGCATALRHAFEEETPKKRLRAFLDVLSTERGWG